MATHAFRRVFGVVLGFVLPWPTVAADSSTAMLQDCLRAAQAIRAGRFSKVEYLGFTDEHQAVYEIEVTPAQGNVWEFECSASTGQIVEIEQEVESADDPLFKDAAKIGEAEARDIATRVYPGVVQMVEYEIQANGQPAYEFDILDRDGVEFKIEVNAATGAIDEVQIELWEIGGP